jgi:hypothetical protein
VVAHPGDEAERRRRRLNACVHDAAAHRRTGIALVLVGDDQTGSAGMQSDVVDRERVDVTPERDRIDLEKADQGGRSRVEDTLLIPTAVELRWVLRRYPGDV